ncbi:MAG: extracellular solute-binding protein, partial [Propionibacteriales bacterium]|nr:extracellular solute-binding protein [Propionibacteriales bacterium]
MTTPHPLTSSRAHRGAAVMLAGSLLLLGACQNGGGEPAQSTAPSNAAEYDQRGPITLVRGKDASGYTAKDVKAWNDANPTEKVTVVELPSEADGQRAALLQNARVKGTEFSLVRIDAVWTAEFASNGYVDELTPADFGLDEYLPTTIDTVTYFDKVYAVPDATGAGLLYYRKDLLEKAGVAAPPKTWQEMKDACAKVKALPEASKIDCYGSQFNKYEGLTVNLGEQIASAGGKMSADGKATVNTPEAKRAMENLTGMFADGTIPKRATTWAEEEGRQAFQNGELVFLRNWAYVYSMAAADDGSSKVNGKFDVAPLPGMDGPGTSMLGGNSWAISKFSKNKGTSREFIKFINEKERMKQRTIATTAPPPLESLYN